METNKTIEINPFYHIPSRPISNNTRSISSKPSKSPTKHQLTSRNQLNTIAHIPEIQPAKKQAKITLGKEQIQKIKYTLDIEEQCKRNYQQRKRTNNYYFKYQPHSFSISKEEETKNLANFYNKNLLIYKQFDNNDSFQAIALLRDKNIKKQLKTKMGTQKMLTPEFANRIKNKRQKQKQYVKLKERTQGTSEIDVSQLLANLAGTSPLEDLENIVSIKEENFFIKKKEQESFNIFKFLKKPDADEFMSGREQLLKNHFSFDSIYNLSNKHFNDQLYRCLSTYSRTATINGNSKSIPNEFQMSAGDAASQFSNQTLQSILMIAKGLIVPIVIKQIKQDYIKDPRQKQTESLADITNKLSYRDNTWNKRVNTQQKEDLDQSQLIYYAKIPLSLKERSIIQFSQQCYTKLKQVVHLKSTSKEKHIDHSKLHLSIENQKKEILMKHIQSINDANIEDDIEKKIRLNKIRKDRGQNIKLATVNKGIKMCKENDRAIKTKSKNKMPIKTQI